MNTSPDKQKIGFWNFVLNVLSFPAELILIQFSDKAKKALADLKEEYKTSFFISVVAAYVVITAFVIRMFILFDASIFDLKNIFIKAIVSIEPFGMLLGLLAMEISWVIFVYVQQETEKKDSDAKLQMEKLGLSVDKINDIVKTYSSISPIHGLRKRLSEISEIYDHCFNKKGKNDLYIMTHNLMYGRVLLHEVESLYSDNERKNMPDIKTMGDFYSSDIKEIREVINEMKIKINRITTTKKIITLDEQRYFELTQRIIDEHKVTAVHVNSTEPFNANHLKGYYWFDSTEIEVKPLEENQLKEMLKKHLQNVNERDYNSLSTAQAEVLRVSYIPFQFIASIPKDFNTVDFDGKCILIFSNLYDKDLSQDENTACFSSINDKLIKNLFYVFQNMEKKHGENLNREQKIKKLFGISSLAKTCFVIHASQSNKLPEARWGIDYRFIDDFITESKIKSILREQFKEHYHLFKDQFITDKIFNLKTTDKHTIIVIGLFENLMTKKLIENTRLFTLIKRGTQKAISINEPEEIFISRYEPGNINGFDYGLFAKIRILGKNIVLCGGCEGFGTRRLGEYLHQNFNDLIDNKESKDHKTAYESDEFISIYKIPIDESRKITLEYHNNATTSINRQIY